MNPLLVKRLRHSDASYFHPYHLRTGMRQKAINLDQDKILSLFPRLGGMPNGTKIPVAVDWYFDDSPPFRTVQTLGLSDKNWRLNSMPWNEHDADENDIVVCQFVGDDSSPNTRTPSSLVFALVRPNQPGYDWLGARVPAVARGERAGFVDISDDELLDAISAGYLGDPGPVTLLVDHLTGGPVEAIAESATGEDVAKARVLALADLEKNGTTREVIERLNLLNAAIGLGGEALAFSELTARAGRGEIADPVWVSRRNARARVDLVHPASQLDGLVGIEVKTTKAPHEADFYISAAEIRSAADFARYEIWRISDLEVSSAGSIEGTLRVSVPDAEIRGALQWLQGAPNGLSASVLRIDPAALPWGDAIRLAADLGQVPDDEWLKDFRL